MNPRFGPKCVRAVTHWQATQCVAPIGRGRYGPEKVAILKVESRRHVHSGTSACVEGDRC